MKTIQNRKYSGIILGMAVRGSINKERTFRVRRGNGHYNAIEGVEYQDQYTYFVPTSITNAEGQAARNAFITAIQNWQALTEGQKKVYNNRASRQGLRMSGYNLYIREYIIEYI